MHLTCSAATHAPNRIDGRADVRVTFASLAQTPEQPQAPGGAGLPSADGVEQDTFEILKRISRRPIDPTSSSELLADLGFDSLQVLEFVGELEDHFEVAVPLNDLTHIRTVGQVVAEVRKLRAAGQEPRA